MVRELIEGGKDVSFYYFGNGSGDGRILDTSVRAWAESGRMAKSSV